MALCQKASQEVSVKTETTRRAAEVCVRVSGRICVSLCERNSRENTTMCGMHLCVCVCFFIERKATVMVERKRDDPWLGSRGEMKKKEERSRRKTEREEERGVEEEDIGGIISFLKLEKPSMVSMSLSHLSFLSLFLHFSHFLFLPPPSYLPFSLSVCLFFLPLGGCNCI